VRLFIADKLAVAKVIATALATARETAIRHDGYFTIGKDAVTWTGASVLELADPEAYNEKYRHWRMEHLPLFPSQNPGDPDAWKYVESNHATAPLAVLRLLLPLVSTFVHAGAMDGDGQWHIDELLHYLAPGNSRKPVPVKRLVIVDLNVPALRDALQDLRDNSEFSSLSASARARAHADWLYGINLTRAYTLLGRYSGHDGVLSLGRIQTPVLALVVGRDESIEQFKANRLTECEARLAGVDNKAFCHAHRQVKESDAGWIDSAGREQLERKLLHTEGRVVSSEITEHATPPPLPYDLAALQIDAAQAHGYTAHEVAESCRQLYEKHHLISYPFVECRYLPERCFMQASDTIENILSLLHHVFPQRDPQLEQQVAQADFWMKRPCWNAAMTRWQHAIMPVTKHSDRTTLEEHEANIYRLVVRNYIAQFHRDFREKTSISRFVIGEETVVAETKCVQDEGWRALFAATRDDSRNLSLPVVPEWQAGERVRCEDVRFREKRTRPPERFSEANLLQALSDLSLHIGSLATIDMLVRRGYLMQGHHSLYATPLGRDLVHALVDTDPVASARRWEAQITAIASGTLHYDEFMASFCEDLREHVERVRQKKTMSLHTADTILGLKSADEKYTCPRCQAVLVLREARQARFWGCSRYPECRFTVPDNPDEHGNHRPDFRVDDRSAWRAGHDKPSSGKTCPDCGKALVQRTGKRGVFLGCSGYPACRHTEPWRAE